MDKAYALQHTVTLTDPVAALRVRVECVACLVSGVLSVMMNALASGLTLVDSQSFKALV